MSIYSTYYILKSATQVLNLPEFFGNVTCIEQILHALEKTSLTYLKNLTRYARKLSCIASNFDHI